MDSILLLFCFSITIVLIPCHGFSVDTENPITFQETVKSFGHSVVQFGSGANAGLLVGAPLQKGEVNETGKLYRCQPAPSKAGRCQEVSLQRPADAINMSLGLSVSAQDSQLLVCGPRVHQTCGENVYLKGYCFLLDQNLRQTRRIPERLPECAKRSTDIVLLIDGSGSIRGFQFSQMKTFISEVMKRFQNTDTQFALSQYSHAYQEHFDFVAFQNARNSDDLIRPIRQLRGATHTATYIRKVVIVSDPEKTDLPVSVFLKVDDFQVGGLQFPEYSAMTMLAGEFWELKPTHLEVIKLEHWLVRELFLPKKGARRDASKVLIVITDGEKSGDFLEYDDVIPEAESAGIIRFAIGVGSAFTEGFARWELDSIASAPASDHVFSVLNFDALKDIQNKLQDKIFAIEGTQFQSSISFQLEMSQEGFSALTNADGSILGTVGAYDWSGGIFLHGNQGDSTFINVSSSTNDMNDAYLGYSVQKVQVNGQRSYVVGAPRYQHTGKVIWFSQENGQWKQKSELSLKQIGSYFGGTLCAVDLDRDSNTDLVLIGAPMYYDSVAGGRVYICQRQGEAFFCGQVLQGEPNHPLGRFGASIVETGEITGDQWTDVAVGAPMEDGNRGAVYIFRGKRHTIHPAFSQRIKATLLGNRLHYFGQTMDAGSDLTDDGLPDIAVGAEGHVLLLRSRPVLYLVARITFTQSMIPISAFECHGQDVLNREVSKARINLQIHSDPRFKFGANILSTVRYTLTLDPGRQKVRAIFDQGSPIITEEMKVGLTPQHKDYRVKLLICIEDSLTPINLQMNYTLMGEPIPNAGNLRAILEEEEPDRFTASLHFEKNCGKDGVCRDQLKTSFNFSGLNELVIGLTPELNATVFIRNDGEDSYSTNLTFFYPSSLSYRRYVLLQSNRKYVVLKCTSVPAAEEDLVRNTTCDINPPVFRSKAEVIFLVTFSVSQDADLGNVVRINATADSENEDSFTKDMFYQAELPVKYAIYVFINTFDESTKYVNFSAGQEDETRTVEHLYEVKNTYQRKVPVSVTFQFPVQLNGTRIWNASLEVPSELFSQVHCAPGKNTPGSKEFVKRLRENPVLDCSVATCKTVVCHIPSLELHQPVLFKIKGDVGFKWFPQTQQKKVTFVSSAQISYDEKTYKQNEGFVQNQVKTMVEFLEAYNYLPIIIGSSVGGLILLALIIAALYKLGFFKRQYKQMIDDAGAGENEGAANPQESSAPPTDTKG